MKFENMTVGSFIQQKTTGDIYYVDGTDENVVYIAKTGKAFTLEKCESSDFRKISVSEAYRDQWVKDNKSVKNKIVYNIGDSGEKGYALVSRTDESHFPFLLNFPVSGVEWVHKHDIIKAKHALVVDYNERINSGWVDENHLIGIKLIALLNNSGNTEILVTN